MAVSAVRCTVYLKEAIGAEQGLPEVLALHSKTSEHPCGPLAPLSASHSSIAVFSGRG